LKCSRPPHHQGCCEPEFKNQIGLENTKAENFGGFWFKTENPKFTNKIQLTIQFEWLTE
jgi:hypothetical protein